MFQRDVLAVKTGKGGQVDWPVPGVVPMRCLKTPYVWLGLGVVLLAPAAPARADFTTPVQTKSISSTQTNWDSTTTSIASVNPFRFDTLQTALKNAGFSNDYISKARLDSVSLTLDYKFDNTINIRYDNAARISVNANGAMNVHLGNSQANLFTPITFQNAVTRDYRPSDVFGKFIPPISKTFAGTRSTTLTDAASLSKFTTGTQVSLPSFAQATSNFSSSTANGFGSSTTFAGATLSLVYTYSIVPEPTSFALCGLGLAGLLGTVYTRSRRDRVKFDPTV